MISEVGSWIQSVIDSQYIQWLALLYRPLIICFMLPIVVVILLYSSILMLLVMKWRNKIYTSYHYDAWRGALQVVTAIWDAIGRIWHSYEVVGLERLPKNGPAMIVYYHGAIPLDIYYMTARCILQLDRRPTPVVDRFLFRVPGFGLLLRVMGAMEGSVDSLAHQLGKEGDKTLLLIAPGGVREGLFSDEYYSLLWGRRTGFAKVAMRAQVPIYPMFTENVREAMRSAQIGKTWLRKLYEATRLPLVPLYGFFPVKLRTVIGPPIFPRPDINQSAEDLAEEVRLSLKSLILQEQILPGNILRSLCQRIEPLNRHWKKRHKSLQALEN